MLSEQAVRDTFPTNYILKNKYIEVLLKFDENY